jgi:hypothetical protein
LNIPAKIVTIPRNNQKGNIVLFPFVLVQAANPSRLWTLTQGRRGLPVKTETARAKYKPNQSLFILRRFSIL